MVQQFAHQRAGQSLEMAMGLDREDPAHALDFLPADLLGLFLQRFDQRLRRQASRPRQKELELAIEDRQRARDFIAPALEASWLF